MIGAGAFTTSGFALADLGSPNLVMLAWLVGGIIAFCGALSYASLSHHLSESGGEYLFLSRVIHPMAGFIAGWVSLLAGFTGAIALAALAFEIYLKPILPVEFPNGTLAVALVIFGALIHGIKLRVGIGLQDFFVFLKLGLILIFVGVAVLTTKSVSIVSDIATKDFSIFSFAGTLVWISLSYSGYNAAVYVAGEAKDKQTTVPKAIWLGTLIVTLLYLALNAVFMYCVPNSLTVGKEDVAAVAATSIGGENLALLVRLIIAISLLTSVFSMLMTGPRVYAQMAQDKLFPDFFRSQGQVPQLAILFQAGAAIILITFSTLQNLLTYLGFTLSICAALTVFCLFLLKRKDNSIKIIGYPFIPLFFILATISLAMIFVWGSPMNLVGTVVTFLSGAILYFIFHRRQLG